MALVIPTARSTYGDATSTPGGWLSSYILAQLADDVDLTWIPHVRALFAIEELKWKPFQQRRERLQAKGDLWKSIVTSMKAATVVIIRPDDVQQSIVRSLESQGAKAGVDFAESDVKDACASALIADTPVAFLPNQLSQALGLYPESLYLTFDQFAPENIKQRIGGSLKDAKIFAARAHATFDIAAESRDGWRTSDSFRQPGSSLVLRELLSTQRGFDEEHPTSAAVLNEAAETIASTLLEVVQFPGELSRQPLVKEFRSHDIDALQAADIAAGWAHELLALGNEKALEGTFGRVILNGTLLRRF